MSISVAHQLSSWIGLFFFLSFFLSCRIRHHRHHHREAHLPLRLQSYNSGRVNAASGRPRHCFHYRGAFHFSRQLGRPRGRCLTLNNYALNPHCYNHLPPLLHDISDFSESFYVSHLPHLLPLCPVSLSCSFESTSRRRAQTKRLV